MTPESSPPSDYRELEQLITDNFEISREEFAQIFGRNVSPVRDKSLASTQAETLQVGLPEEGEQEGFNLDTLFVEPALASPTVGFSEKNSEQADSRIRLSGEQPHENDMLAMAMKSTGLNVHEQRYPGVELSSRVESLASAQVGSLQSRPSKEEGQQSFDLDSLLVECAQASSIVSSSEKPEEQTCSRKRSRSNQHLAKVKAAKTRGLDVHQEHSSGNMASGSGESASAYSKELDQNQKTKLDYMLGLGQASTSHYVPAPVFKEKTIRKQGATAELKKKRSADLDDLRHRINILAKALGKTVDTTILPEQQVPYSLEQVKKVIDTHQLDKCKKLREEVGDDLAAFMQTLCNWKHSGPKSKLREVIHSEMKSRNLSEDLLNEVKGLQSNMQGWLRKNRERETHAKSEQKLNSLLQTLQSEAVLKLEQLK